LVANGRRTFLRLHRHHPFDLLHIHFAYAGLGPLLTEAARRIPVVRSFYGSWAHEYRAEANLSSPVLSARAWIGFALREAVERFSLRRSDRIIVASQYSWK